MLDSEHVAADLQLGIVTTLNSPVSQYYYYVAADL